MSSRRNGRNWTGVPGGFTKLVKLFFKKEEKRVVAGGVCKSGEFCAKKQLLQRICSLGDLVENNNGRLEEQENNC